MNQNCLVILPKTLFNIHLLLDIEKVFNYDRKSVRFSYYNFAIITLLYTIKGMVIDMIKVCEVVCWCNMLLFFNNKIYFILIMNKYSPFSAWMAHPMKALVSISNFNYHAIILKYLEHLLYSFY